MLELTVPERKLYLGISNSAYHKFFKQKAVDIIIRRHEIALLVVDVETEEILKWLARYQNLIKRFMNTFAEIANSRPAPNTEMVVIFDDRRKRYMLLNMGWTKNGHLHHTTLHVYLREGKFWIEEDWTEN